MVAMRDVRCGMCDVRGRGAVGWLERSETRAAWIFVGRPTAAAAGRQGRRAREVSILG
jgi:hypothetical protein